MYLLALIKVPLSKLSSEEEISPLSSARVIGYYKRLHIFLPLTEEGEVSDMVHYITNESIKILLVQEIYFEVLDCNESFCYFVNPIIVLISEFLAL